MKGLEKRNIAALFALLLVGAILTSTRANSTDFNEPFFDEDNSYLEQVEDYVDDYMESIVSDDIDDEAEVVKIFGEDGELILQEELGDDMSEEMIKLIRQSDFLTEYENTTYYRLNS